jgi:hypothetical protein
VGPVFLTLISAARPIVVVNVLALFVESNSVIPAAGETLAVFAIEPVADAFTKPLIVITTEPLAGSVGILPLTVFAATFTDAGHKAPPASDPQVAEVTVTFAGTLSRNVASSAAAKPAAFEMVRV